MNIRDNLIIGIDNISDNGILLHGRDRNRILSRIGGVIKLFFRSGNPENMKKIIEIADTYMKLEQCKISHIMTETGKRVKINHDEISNYKFKSGDQDQSIDIYEDIGNNYYSVPLWHFQGASFSGDNITRPLSGIEIHFPAEFFFSNTDIIIDLTIKMSVSLNVIHGIAGLGVLGTPGSELSSDAFWYPWIQKYNCLDYGSMGIYWSATRKGGYTHPFSSNWLTILGQENIDRLGEESRIRTHIIDTMDYIPFHGGCIIKASDKPVLGNNTKEYIPVGYRNAARIIKPIRFEDYMRGIIKTPKNLGYTKEQNLQYTLDWLRRFD